MNTTKETRITQIMNMYGMDKEEAAKVAKLPDETIQAFIDLEFQLVKTRIRYSKWKNPCKK